MYNQYIVLFPVARKGPELRTLLMERVKAANAAGTPHALTTRMFSSDSALTVVIRHPDLTAVESYQDKNEADPAFQQFRDDVTSVIGHPSTNTMYREITAPDNPRGTVYISRIFFRPILGKGPELSKLLEERALDNNSRGVPAGLLERVVAAGGPTYMMTFHFPNLEAFQNRTENQPADPGFAAFNAKLNQLIELAPEQVLSRVIVGFPGG